MHNLSSLLEHNETRLRASVWLVFLLVAASGLSLVFSCATSFAALAALSALTLKRTHAILFILAAWVINQAMGFGFLHYPQDSSTFIWGVVIGASALASLFFAQVAQSTTSKLRYSITLIAAFIGFQFIILLANLTPLGSLDTFDFESKSQIALIDMVAFAGLIIAQKLAATIGLFAAPKTVAA